MTRFSRPVRFSSTAAYWPARPMRLRSSTESRTTSRPVTRTVPASGLRTDESQVLWTGKGSFEIVVLGCG
jgi:hypothetical protein